mmetsp:Transcript_30368/g.51976  ORF Transcript_30368/g.51976 Transcript_30368/m.51976 type:complete len:228 (-) Transcript_30368:91-774(-)
MLTGRHSLITNVTIVFFVDTIIGDVTLMGDISGTFKDRCVNIDMSLANLVTKCCHMLRLGTLGLLNQNLTSCIFSLFIDDDLTIGRNLSNHVRGTLRIGVPRLRIGWHQRLSRHGSNNRLRVDCCSRKLHWLWQLDAKEGEDWHSQPCIGRSHHQAGTECYDHGGHDGGDKYANIDRICFRPGLNDQSLRGINMMPVSIHVCCLNCVCITFFLSIIRHQIYVNRQLI